MRAILAALVAFCMVGWCVPAGAEKGFDIYEGVSAMGEQIKMSTADSPAGCQVVCSNTPGCIAATYDEFFRGKNVACLVYRAVRSTMKSPSATMMVRTRGAAN